MNAREPLAPRKRRHLLPATVIALLISLLILLPSLVAIAPARSSAPNARRLLYDDDYLRRITERNPNLVYIGCARVLIVSAAKSGTSSLFQFLYRGATASAVEHTYSRCHTFVQNVSSHCWLRRATFVHQHPRAEQRFILTSDDVLRVAVQRPPFERLLSAFKSKFSCETRLYNTNTRNRHAMVPQLRRLAALPPRNASCMSVSEFALALSRVQRRALLRRFDLQRLDVHIRPQRLFADAVAYHAVLDVSDLSNVSALAPIIRRLPFGALVAAGVPHRHASGSYELQLPERAARRLLRFAAESEVLPAKYA